MTMSQTATTRITRTRHGERRGLLLGFLGVAVFSLSLPMTRLAVLELPVYFTAFARIALAGLAGIFTLALTRAAPPTRAQWVDLSIVAAGVVFGFPFLMTIAMRSVDASHGGVVLAVLPLLTAVVGAIINAERPSPTFWASAVAGFLSVLLFVLLHAKAGSGAADLLLCASALAAAIGYAYGGRLARSMPGIVVIAWALVLSMPVALSGTAITWWMAEDLGAGAAAWSGFLYVALGSQFAGFWFWYRGLAVGGIAKVSQVQLLQTFLTLAAAALILGETLDPSMIVFATITVGCIILARRSRVG